VKSKKFLKGVVVEHDAVIGGNATILAGVRIGSYALVGAGSVVVRDVPTGKVVAGNPAKILKDVHDLQYLTGEHAYEVDTE
jgi:acetyltransferase-like isoleucine patch superfamily enzyme